MHRDVNAILTSLHCNFTSEELADKLTSGQMQMMAIARALYHKSNIISLDEPTASLSIRETEALFDVIKQLKSQGVTILYVSHRLEEIFRICDQAVIMRDGEYITTLDVPTTSRDELIHAMVGRAVSAVASRNVPCMATDEVVLKAEGLTGPTGFKNVSFELHKGEILGFFGLVGAGRTETMRAIFGADMITGGKVWLKGKRVNTSSWNTDKALKAGIGLIPEDRKTQGFLKLMSNIQNISISSLEDYVNAFNLLVDAKKRANAEHFFSWRK